MKHHSYILFLTLILTLCLSSCVRYTGNENYGAEKNEELSTTVCEEENSITETVSSLTETDRDGTTCCEETSAAAKGTAEERDETTEASVQNGKDCDSDACPVTETEEKNNSDEAESTSVDLTVELPEANGEMQVDCSPDNTFIRTVSEKMGLDASLLAAVYTVPANNQNYVLEFYTSGTRTKDNLRRVYLLDDNCVIESVAAENTNEKENINATENWFCFNVLVKGVVFGAIEDRLNR